MVGEGGGGSINKPARTGRRPCDCQGGCHARWKGSRCLRHAQQVEGTRRVMRDVAGCSCGHNFRHIKEKDQTGQTRQEPLRRCPTPHTPHPTPHTPHPTPLTPSINHTPHTGQQAHGAALFIPDAKYTLGGNECQLGVVRRRFLRCSVDPAGSGHKLRTATYTAASVLSCAPMIYIF